MNEQDQQCPVPVRWLEVSITNTFLWKLEKLLCFICITGYLKR